MLLWSFLSTMFTPTAKVPLEYRLTNEEAESFVRGDDQHKDSLLKGIQSKRNLVLLMRTPYGLIRYCTFCKVIKPDRTHHCSTCGICVLKMDHHCGWINNCVGFSNYKNFFLLLFYCNAYCLYFTMTTMKYFILYLNTQESCYLPVVVGFLIATFIGLVGVIFFFYNSGILLKNETTLEKIQEVVFTQDNASFNLGCWKNFIQVFGKKWTLWLLPVFSSVGNGAEFPISIKPR